MKKILIITISIITLAGAALVFSALEKDEMLLERANTVSSEIPANNSDPSASSTPSGTEGSYVDYYDGIVAKTSGTKVLFFHAPWCPQCRDLEASIKEQGVPSGVTIIKVDYDSSQKLRQQYGVTIQTTLVKVDDSGNLIKKYVAYDEPNLDSVKRNLL